ncbi:mitochondrial inner membrane translocase complex, subunit Tim44-related protein [Wolffia australiana]
MALRQFSVRQLLRRGLGHREAPLTSLWGGPRDDLRVASEVSRSDYTPLMYEYHKFRTVFSSSSNLDGKTTVRNSSEELKFFLSSESINRRPVMLRDVKLMSTQVKVPAQALRQGGLQVTMLSPGFIYEPYKPREPIPFWRRWFTRSGWRRTKEDMIMELKNAYAVARLRKKTGYSRKEFYQEALKLYKEINTHLAAGDKASLRKLVTENMFSAFKNDLKRRESTWKSVYWELVEPVVKIRTLRARMIGVDKNDLDKAFVQLTIEFLTKQKFEAYDSTGAISHGDKTKEVLVRDIWVLEKSLFLPGSYWRLCGRISL